MEELAKLVSTAGMVVMYSAEGWMEVMAGCRFRLGLHLASEFCSWPTL